MTSMLKLTRRARKFAAQVKAFLFADCRLEYFKLERDRLRLTLSALEEARTNLCNSAEALRETEGFYENKKLYMMYQRSLEMAFKVNPTVGNLRERIKVYDTHIHILECGAALCGSYK